MREKPKEKDREQKQKDKVSRALNAAAAAAAERNAAINAAPEIALLDPLSAGFPAQPYPRQQVVVQLGQASQQHAAMQQPLPTLGHAVHPSSFQQQLLEQSRNTFDQQLQQQLSHQMLSLSPEQNIGTASQPRHHPQPDPCKSFEQPVMYRPQQSKIGNNSQLNSVVAMANDKGLESIQRPASQQDEACLSLADISVATSIKDADLASVFDLLNDDLSDVEGEYEQQKHKYQNGTPDNILSQAASAFGVVTDRNAVAQHERGYEPNEDARSRENTLANEMDSGEGKAPARRLMTLNEWLQGTLARHQLDSRDGNGQTQSLGRVIITLPVALKLAEFLDVEDSSMRGDECSPRYINLSQAMIEADESGEETVHSAWFSIPSAAERSDSSTSQRLVAFGSMLYTLFTGKVLVDDKPASADAKSTSLGSITLDDSLTETDHLQPHTKAQRSQRQLDHSGSSRPFLGVPDGLPYSLQTLLISLLENSNGEFQKDDTCTTFSDAIADLQQMIEKPERHLYDIDVASPLELPNELYGRHGEIHSLTESYKKFRHGGLSNGMLISGGPGVGKSQLAMYLQKLTGSTEDNDTYFVLCKYDQSRDIMPLSTVGSVFNSLCEQFVSSVDYSTLAAAQMESLLAFGSQAARLVDVVPSIVKLMPSIRREGLADSVDSSLSMRFLFGELLRVLSSHCRSISFFIDDLQWADPSSLSIIQHLIATIQGSGISTYFVCCYRDEHKEDKDKIENCDAFPSWLATISKLGLDEIHLGTLDMQATNELVSDALHLSRRITQPLASVLFHKTSGNPLYLCQLMVNLAHDGLLKSQLQPPRWIWDIEKISSLSISEDVLAFLLEGMQVLDAELQLGLKVASCIGSYIRIGIVDILSNELETENLKEILSRVADKGYMDVLNDDVYRFAHDKIQQVRLLQTTSDLSFLHLTSRH